MLKDLDVFFSNRLEVLYQHLKHSLFDPAEEPLRRRLVVVYGPAMQSWLMLKMAQDPDLCIAAGIEFIYLNQAFEYLSKLISPEPASHFPSLLELTLAIEIEIASLLQNYQHLSQEEQTDWDPLIHYLKLDPSKMHSKIHLSFKGENRLISLSQHVARLFQDYGRYAYALVSRWELPDCKGWQPRLWRQIFGGNLGWTYPSRTLQQSQKRAVPASIYFFSISFISACEFSFLRRLAKCTSVAYYLLSPCAVFWSDIRTDRESAYLEAYWQRKLGGHSPKLLQLEELLRDRNPLLANFGRLGREMACQIEESHAQTYAQYVLSGKVQALDPELFIQEDLCLTAEETSLTLLQALQADLLMMRHPQGGAPFNFDEEQTSVQLHIAPCLRREVQILYHNLLGLMAKDPTLCPSEIIVMAPQISDYVPYIQSVFGIESSRLDFQILDLGMHAQSEIVQGFLQLLQLSASRWDASQLLQLFEHRSFQRRHQLTASDLATIQGWVEQTGIRWGDDWLHRNELLQRHHCQKEMVEESATGTWDYGISRLLMGLTMVLQANAPILTEISPCASIDFSQGDLLGKWIRLLHSLRDDLSPLHDRTQMTMEDWVNYLFCLLENYFQPDYVNKQSVEEYEDLKKQIEVLRAAAGACKEALFPFASVQNHLVNLMQLQGITYREDHLQAVRFCSMVPLRSIPARVIALMGMQEGAFPRIVNRSSLNLMLDADNVDYCPLSVDYDRYLFLEVLQSVQDNLLMSYQGYSRQDNKELQPSLIIEELFSYLDRCYTIQEKKISECCVIKHPFDAIDASYFRRDAHLHNFSLQDYEAAQKLVQVPKSPPHCFISEFSLGDSIIQETIGAINLKHLTSVARDPIKFHLKKALEIYLENEEDRKFKTEEDLTLSALDKHLLKQFAPKDTSDNILRRAELEGKLPLGLFKHVAAQRLHEEIEEVGNQLKKYSLDTNDIFQIEFCTSCSIPTQINEEKWLYPAPVVELNEDCRVSIVGKLSHASAKGLFLVSKGAFADIWKVWPQFLLYCHAAKFDSQKLNPRMIFAHTSASNEPFLDDPEPYLKEFIRYYTLCLQHVSPLLPDWIPLILKADAAGLQKKMDQLHADPFGFPNQSLRWILNKHCLPKPEILIANWKSQAELLLGNWKI